MTAYTDFVNNPVLLHPTNPAYRVVQPPPLVNYPVDTHIENLIINDALITDQIAQAVTGGEIVETMDYAAGTLTFSVIDKQRTLIKGLLSQWVSANTPVLYTSVVGQRRQHKVVPAEWNEIYCTFDGRDYALVQCNKNGDQFDLMFENRSIHELRRYTRPHVWYRDTYTRAEVIQWMCEEVKNYHVPFYAPELDIVQPIQSTKGLPTPKEVASHKLKGFSKKAKFTIKGHPATSQQRSHISAVIRVGESMKATYVEEVAALMQVIEISNANLIPLSATQQEFGGGEGLFGFINPTGDMARDAHAYFTKARYWTKTIPGIASEDICYNIMVADRGGGSAAFDFTSAEFARWRGEAERILQVWGVTGHTGGSVTYTEYNRYAFKRGLDGKREDSWNCAVRLAKEVNWRVFSTDNIIWWVDDNDLRRAVPWDTISEATEGIDSIDWEIDSGKPLNEVTITAHLNRWQIPPGVPVTIEDSGPADCDWLVFEVRRPLNTDVAEITCHLTSPPLSEPAPTTQRVTIRGSRLGVPIAVTGNSKVDAAYAKAVEINNKHYPYVYAGGHVSDFS